jgi:hypothetical protein
VTASAYGSTVAAAFRLLRTRGIRFDGRMASMQSDTHGWAWDRSEYSSVAVGDTGPWVSWLPLAWRAVTDPLGEHALPPAPRPVGLGDADSRDYACAWWGPLLQLLFFAKGWVRPDLGLARWLGLGQPDDDPVLKIVSRWWGSRVVEVLARRVLQRR